MLPSSSLTHHTTITRCFLITNEHEHDEFSSHQGCGFTHRFPLSSNHPDFIHSHTPSEVFFQVVYQLWVETLDKVLTSVMSWCVIPEPWGQRSYNNNNINLNPNYYTSFRCLNRAQVWLAARRSLPLEKSFAGMVYWRYELLSYKYFTLNFDGHESICNCLIRSKIVSDSGTKMRAWSMGCHLKS